MLVAELLESTVANSNSEMHECLSIRLSECVKSVVQDLNDSKIIGKLSEGDMVATEAKYHNKCFLSFFNQHSQQKSRAEDCDGECDFIKGILHKFGFDL